MMFFSAMMKSDVWIAPVDLTKRPRQYGEPVKYRINAVDTVDHHTAGTEGSRPTRIMRGTMDKRYGAAIKPYDKAWVRPTGSVAPETDILGTGAEYVVRGLKHTPLVMRVELEAVRPFEGVE